MNTACRFAPRLVTAAVALAALSLGACENTSTPAALEPTKAASIFATGTAPGQQLPPTLDDEFVALANQVPGFGGLFQDPSSEDILVYLMDLEQAPAAQAAVGSYLTREGAALRQLRFIRGNYDFRDLARWRRQIDQTGRGLLTMSDVQEAMNPVLIGVKDEASLEMLAAALPALGIPSAAVTFLVVGFAVEQNLQGFARPVRGGLRVKAKDTQLGCTLGFVVIREFPGPVYDFSGPRFVITASHCTTSFGVDLDDIIGQPSQADRIGVEFSDPPLFSFSEDTSCPSFENICRRSDAAMFLLDDNSDAVSTFNGVATASGTTLTGTAFYAGKQYSYWSNQSVRKIGQISGQTSGVITNTCVNTPFPGRTLVCQMYATYSSSDGDSGAPVWHNDTSGNRWVAGIHVGRNNDLNVAIFSVWVNAYAEIGNDVLARTGEQWNPAFSSGPGN